MEILSLQKFVLKTKLNILNKLTITGPGKKSRLSLNGSVLSQSA